MQKRRLLELRVLAFTLTLNSKGYSFRFAGLDVSLWGLGFTVSIPCEYALNLEPGSMWARVMTGLLDEGLTV